MNGKPVCGFGGNSTGHSAELHIKDETLAKDAPTDKMGESVLIEEGKNQNLTNFIYKASPEQEYGRKEGSLAGSRSEEACLAFRLLFSGDEDMKKRKNEAKKDILLYNFIKDNKKYKNSWDIKKTDDDIIQSILAKASKKKTGNRGEPDLLYVNNTKKLLIILEDKPTIGQHESKDGNDPEHFAVDGVKHYLSFFTENSISIMTEPIRKYLKSWNIVGIAVSGDILDEYNCIISTFVVNKNEIKDVEIKEILNEEDYLSLFQNVDMEKLIRDVSESSKRINNQLRSLDSQKRPVLLSGLMICLFTRKEKNDFKEGYIGWNPKTIINNIPTTISQILLEEGIPEDKIEVLTNELAFIKTDPDLNNTNILRGILQELDTNVIPLFAKETNYDILGKFYEEFLRYAGVTNVKNGIVLTPNHITKLFTELIDVRINDVILDICCGTGTFLISAMNKIVLEIMQSSLKDKKKLIKKIKENQLIGFDKSTTMYALCISNMLFRGDGKSRIYNVDSFSKDAKGILCKLKEGGINPTIGFINPPYGGKDTKEKPTKKEIQFLEVMLDNVSRYGVIIAPLSTYIQDEVIKKRILSKHTLKCVINMPKELFQPNAAIHTAIAVFETNKPHKNRDVIFYDLNDDGYILSKNRGRTDPLNKWINIKKKLFEELSSPDKYVDNLHLMKLPITGKDEWIIQAHSKADYATLNKDKFVQVIKKYTIFSFKFRLGLLDKNMDELTLFEILKKNELSDEEVEKMASQDIDVSQWKDFTIKGLFGNNIDRGMRLIEIDRTKGDCSYYSASNKDNGLTDMIGNPLFTKTDAIIYSTFGDCFYVEGEFTASDEICILKHPKLNKFNGLFIVTILGENKYKYGFGRKAFRKKLVKDVIKLPVDADNNPDWDFMEKYIKSLPYSINLEI